MHMNSILDKIADYKRYEVAKAKQSKPIESLREVIAPKRNFIDGLKQTNPAVIAEIKKASPSKGIICSEFDVATIAKTYQANGACCLSVLTDVHFFQGDPSYIAIAKVHSTLPVLRKDFIIDSYQIYESQALGADCILLIAAMLDDYQLHDFCQQAQELTMSVLVESHTSDELKRALTLPTPLIGINNRSLHNFSTNLNTTLELANDIPSDKIIITESGINTRDDVLFMLKHKISTFLIGESLMRAADPGLKLKELLTDNFNSNKEVG